METIKELASIEYFGNTLFEYTLFLACIVAGIVAGKIFYYICRSFLRRHTEKSESKFDEHLVDIIEEPIVLLLVTIGFWLGQQFLTLSEGAGQFFDNIVFVLVAITVTWFLLRLIDMLITNYVAPLVTKSESKLDDQILPILRKSARGIIAILAVIIILSNLGYDILSLLAGLGIGGLALALAAQDAVKNVIGGFTIFWDKPFQIDDFIELGGESGSVHEVGVRSTRLKTAGGTTIVIPNSKIADSVLENFSTRIKRRVVVNIGLTYETSAEQMEAAFEEIRRTIRQVEGTEAETIEVRFINFGAYSLDLEIVYWITDMDNWKVIIHQVNIGLKRNLDTAGVEMAFPTETHFVRQG